MTDLTPSEVVRDFYITSGRKRERALWLAALAALRESINEIRASNPDRITHNIADHTAFAFDRLEATVETLRKINE